MKLLLLLFLTATGLATPLDKRQSCTSAVSLSGNPFVSKTLHPTSKHQTEILSGAVSITDAALSAQASRAANFGTFLWLDELADLSTLDTELQAVPCSNILGIVLDNLPTSSCSAIEQLFDTFDLSTYKSDYIDSIVRILKSHPEVAVAAIIAPGAVGNLITNIADPTCTSATSVIKDALTYALQQLNLPNIILYVDASDGGTLGWPANLQPAAQLIASIYKNAGSPKQFRGFSTNVANYNAWSKNPGEFVTADDSQDNPAQDEKRYVSLFADGLASVGVSNYAIVDTSRNAVQGLRLAWGDWCNINGAGLGVRPTSNTSDVRTDAFVWVKAAGESDGTSDPSDSEYNEYCGKADAFKPSPRRGVWNQAYFNMLLTNAVPSI